MMKSIVVLAFTVTNQTLICLKDDVITLIKCYATVKLFLVLVTRTQNIVILFLYLSVMAMTK